MKLIDKFLKKLNTSRNTFATYILTLVTIFTNGSRMTWFIVIIDFIIFNILFIKSYLKKIIK